MSNNLPAGPDDFRGAPDAGLAEVANRGFGYRPPPAPEEGVNWRRHLSALYRYKWLVLLGTILGAGAGIAGTKLITPRYVAQASLWISDGGGGARAGFGPILPSQLLATYSWVELAKSFIVLDPVVNELKLYVHPVSPADSAAFSTFGVANDVRNGFYRLDVDATGRSYTLSGQEGVAVASGTVGDSIGTQVGFAWVPPAGSLRPGSSIAFSVVAPRDAAAGLRSQLNPRIDQSGTFLQLELTGTRPTIVAATVNATARHYVDIAAELKRGRLSEQTKLLGEQLSYARLNMERAQNALEVFKVRTVTLPTESGAPIAAGLMQTANPVLANYLEIKIQREQLRRDRERIQTLINEGTDSAGPSADALRVVASVQTAVALQGALTELTDKQAELRNLQFKYTDQYEEVRRLRSQVQALATGTIPALADALVRDIRARESELDRRIAADSSEMQEIPRRAIEEARLGREMQSATDLYTNLQKRHEEVRLAEVSSIPDVRVLTLAAVPRNPLSETASRIVLLGIAAGLFFGLGGALFIDRMDKRVRYPEQVSDELGLAILGAVPHIKGTRNGNVQGEAAAEIVESLRGVRLGLSHAHGAAGPFIATISSPGPGDGKSFLSSNLAMTYAGTGLKTLLIDGDTRRGELHRLFNVSRKPGLLDLLGGTATREQIIQSTQYPGLDFIGAGTRSQKGPELLQSPLMTKLILSLRGTYQVILVDSPPLNAGIDPFVLGTATGNLVLVVRTGVTDRELAGAKLDVLDRLPVRVLGAVLNDIRATSSYRYYRYQYSLKGYEAEDEGEAEVRMLAKK